MGHESWSLSDIVRALPGCQGFITVDKNTNMLRIEILRAILGGPCEVGLRAVPGCLFSKGPPNQGSAPVLVLAKNSHLITMLMIING